MKIQIDTNQKVIRLLESANFAKFVKFAKKLLGEEYEKFTLECTHETVYWYNPIYIPYTQPYIQPYYDYTTPVWTHISTTVNPDGSTFTAADNLKDGEWLVTEAIKWDPNAEVHIYNFDIQEIEESTKN